MENIYDIFYVIIVVILRIFRKLRRFHGLSFIHEEQSYFKWSGPGLTQVMRVRHTCEECQQHVGVETRIS